MTASRVLTVNAGSSSVKFAVFGPAGRQLAGAVERIGTPDAKLKVKGSAEQPLTAADPAAAADQLLDWLAEHADFETITAVGHRVVHGGPDHVQPQAVDAALLADLRKTTALDPDHLPAEIALIEAVARRRPNLPQVACFDTAFHSTLPTVARTLPLPRKYGLRRFGFHGLSYAYLMDELRKLDPAAADGRVILAHLGSGASMAAVRNGVCVDTTMSFTPTAGLVMGTRTGDLDPGVIVHLLRTEKLSADDLDKLVNKQSGLLGVSETSADMRDLAAKATTDPRAAEAIDLFCYQAQKFVGALAAALGGLDALVFAGGIGENAPDVRLRICDDLAFLGIDISRNDNDANAAVISSGRGRVAVRVVKTDEEVMIARTVGRVLNLLEPTP